MPATSVVPTNARGWPPGHGAPGGSAAGRDPWDLPGWQLPVAQLCDATLPTGGFSHSHGLESFLSDGRVSDEASYLRWLRMYLRGQLTTGDALAMVLALQALDDGDLPRCWALDRLLHALTVPREVRAAAGTMGRRMIALARIVAPGDMLDAYDDQVRSGACRGNPALAVALAGHALGAPPGVLVGAWLQAAVVSLTQNAVRAVPLGQDAGQRVIAALRPDLVAAVARARSLTIDDLGAVPAGLEVAQMRHERQLARMFMS